MAIKTTIKMNTTSNLFLKISVAILLLLCIFVGHRTQTGGTFARAEGGFFFIKNELSTQFRYHIDTVYKRNNIKPQNYPINDYKHYLILEEDNQSVLIQAATYQYHYLNLIPIFLFYLAFICLMMWFYKQEKPIIYFLFLAFSYGTVFGIEYYRASLRDGLLHDFFESILLLLWFLCVVAGAVSLFIMDKTKFNKRLYWLQIIFSSLLFVFICYHFIDVNIKNATN